LDQSNNSYKTYEHQENSIYNKIFYDQGPQRGEVPADGLFVGCTNEKYLALYRKKCKDLVANFPVTECYITCIEVSPRLGAIFLGTSKGCVRMSVWPLEEDNLQYEMLAPNSNKVSCKSPDFYEIAVHASAVTCLALTHDDEYLFSGDEDGIIFTLRLGEVYQHGELVDREHFAPSQIKPEDRQRIEMISNDLFLAKIS